MEDYMAFYEGSVERVENLIRQGKDLNQKDHGNNTPLSISCTKEYYPIVKLLLNGIYVQVCLLFVY
jgi:ankyrin repeat protein